MDIQTYLPPESLWPDLIIPEECKDLPHQFNLTDFLLEKHLRQGRGDRTAIYFEDEKISYAEIARQVNRLGSSLINLNIRPRDRVGIRMTGRPQAIVANMAVLKIGAIPVPVPPLWSPTEIAYVAEDAELKAMVVDCSLLSAVKQAQKAARHFVVIVVNEGAGGPHSGGDGYAVFSGLIAGGEDKVDAFRLKRNDAAVLVYTSGTTGRPKGCVHTAAGVLIASSISAKYVWGLKQGDVLGGSAPVSFAAGFGTFAFVPFTSHSAISLLPKFSAEALLQNISRHKITVLTGIPTAYRKMLESPALDRCDLTSLRQCTVGGDLLDAATLEAWREKTGLPIWISFGTTENFHILMSTWIGKSPLAKSVGQPLPGYEARVVDTDGRDCESGQVGMLHFRGPTGAIYWNPAAQNGRLLRQQQSSVKNGWNVLDDLVVRDEAGNICFIGRHDNMIKSSGYRLSPEEIEAVIFEHPRVKEVAVTGVPDKIRGQALKALVVAAQGSEPGPELEMEIKSFLRRRIALYKVPHLFQFVSDLPKTSTGKVVRKRLSHFS